MSEPDAGWGWNERALESTESAPREAGSHRRRPAATLLLVGVAAAVVIALLALRPSGAHSPGPLPTTTTGWSSRQGVTIRTGYLARCEAAGGSATHCGCLFATITGQPHYQTPAAFAALNPAATSPSPAAAAVVAQAAQACSAPSSSPTPPGRHPT